MGLARSIRAKSHHVLEVVGNAPAPRHLQFELVFCGFLPAVNLAGKAGYYRRVLSL
jgi:hypothetical protein